MLKHFSCLRKIFKTGDVRPYLKPFFRTKRHKPSECYPFLDIIILSSVKYVLYNMICSNSFYLENTDFCNHFRCPFLCMQIQSPEVLMLLTLLLLIPRTINQVSVRSLVDLEMAFSVTDFTLSIRLKIIAAK